MTLALNVLNLCARQVHPVADSDDIEAAVPAALPAADQGVHR